MSTTITTPATDSEKRQGLGTAFVIFVIAVVLLFAGTYTYVFLSSKPVNPQPLWTGTGTVVSQQEVHGARKESENCFRYCSYVRTTSWELTVREDSGAVTNVPVTKQEFDTLAPGQTFTRK